jgi:hypothetical protein
MTALPLDIWLDIFDLIPDRDTLWSTVRNVSHYHRSCVDGYFQRYVLRDTVIDLIYSTIHTQEGPIYHFLHTPMRFDRLTEDGTRAVFKQVRSKDQPFHFHGSVRGWVPFIERYYRDIGKPLPTVTNKSKSDNGLPMWTKGYQVWREHPHNEPRLQYLRRLRDHTSVGRGDRPPYLIRLPHYARNADSNDTEIFGLEIDCGSREISLLWHQTFSAFFVEAHFVALANQQQQRQPKAVRREYDAALNATAREVLMSSFNPLNREFSPKRRARRKRLATWVASNKKRMSDVHRLLIEDSIFEGIQLCSSAPFAPGRLIELQDDMDSNETVPESCGPEHKALMMWPATSQEWKELEPVLPRRREHHQGCTIL